MQGIDLNTELSAISGVGQKFAAKLKKLDIRTVRELLWHFPFRYEDYSRIVPIGELEIDQSVTVQGRVHQLTTRRAWKKSLVITEAIIVDESGGIKAVWFNQPYIANSLREGSDYNFAGKVTKSKREIYLASPSFEPINSFGRTEARHTAGLIPIYPETRGLTSKGFRYLIKPMLKQLGHIEDFLPEEILEEQKLPTLNLSIKRIHFPLRLEDAELARKRFAFEDLFLLQLLNLKTRARLAQKRAVPIGASQEEIGNALARVPFTLTQSQKASLHEVCADIAKPHPMNRLLQGDVGSGKTVIAAVAAALTAEKGHQAVFMAPTEVLAGQHYRTFIKIFPDFDRGVALLTANKSEAYWGASLGRTISKSALHKEIASGNVKIVIGTHAVIQKGVAFRDLALSIVDEQHRFGVRQRAQLVHGDDQRAVPHFLSMSATPIPRTLSLTVFGDLDLSTITELPGGRKPVITKVIDSQNRQKAYGFIGEQIKKGRQAFVICPRIDPGSAKEGEVLSEAKRKALELKSVKEEYEKLSRKVFSEFRVAMLHGKLKGKEKDEIMRDFQEGNYDVLVSTSVIEVGVDVPNATIMMIEGSDRFGLAQLYQFRGRVGRGAHQSYCLLFTDSDSATARKRLQYLTTAKNGFELAEKDLLLRGPGQFLGDQQTGMPDVAMDALKDIQLVKAARDSAKRILSNDPEFAQYSRLAEHFKNFEKKIHLE